VLNITIGACSTARMFDMQDERNAQRYFSGLSSLMK
jgi:hypothetical protein